MNGSVGFRFIAAMICMKRRYIKTLFIKNSGFTLIELLVTISIAAIITTVAVPSFTSMIKNNRATFQANALLAGLNLARSESIKRGQRVTVCPRKNPRTTPETCSNSTNWVTGALVFTDETGTRGLFDSSDVIIRVLDTLSGNPTVIGTNTNVQFLPSGDSQAATTITLTMPNCRGEQSKEIEVTLTGRGKINRITC